MWAALVGAPCELEIQFTNEDEMQRVPMKVDGSTDPQELCMFTDREDISGTITVKPLGAPLVHEGIKIECIGQIELFYDRGNNYEFTSLVREIDGPGRVDNNREFPFEFLQVEKKFESYSGINVRQRYFIRVTISRSALYSNVVQEFDIVVQNIGREPEINNSIKMEVGIEDCLHIEFEYNKSKYHLQDVVLGKIYFLLVRIKIKHMEVEIRRRETTGAGANLYNESETIAKFEIMDGAPVRGESIPIRLFMNGFQALSPTYRNVNNKFSVKYYLNLVLVDEEDRRYFKQQEIQIWRRELGLGA
jgi:vacuolar protein sorting-associated protein 26